MYGVSLKDRAAILPSGHMADGAFWFDTKSGNFVSSSFYYKELPGWVKEFNVAAPGGEVSRGDVDGAQAAGGQRQALSRNWSPRPYGNELIEAFAERALEAGATGQA